MHDPVIDPELDSFIPDPRNLFADVDASKPVIVAVSGGSDSLALLLLASAWAKDTGAEIQVVTVDHGLRPEAAAEAAFVAAVSEGLYLPHFTLVWDGIKPSSGIISAARMARYGLLESYASDSGIETILTGHTANDQAETVLMRSARDTSEIIGRGLAGMAQRVILPHGTHLVRPLLDISRIQLRRYLKHLHQSWIDDPTNGDESYERVRVRNALGQAENRIFEICRYAQLNGRYREQISNRAAIYLEQEMGIKPGGVYCLDVASLKALSYPVGITALQIIITIAGGASYFPSSDVVRRLIAGERGGRSTLGNAVIERIGGKVRVYREKRNLPTILVSPGEDAIWDGRLKITNNSQTVYFCGPVDTARLEMAENELKGKLPVFPRAAIHTMPYLCGDKDDVYFPFLPEPDLPENLECSLVSPAIEHFCPSYDFALLETLDVIRQKLRDSDPHLR